MANGMGLGLSAPVPETDEVYEGPMIGSDPLIVFRGVGKMFTACLVIEGGLRARSGEVVEADAVILVQAATVETLDNARAVCQALRTAGYVNARSCVRGKCDE